MPELLKRLNIARGVPNISHVTGTPQSTLYLHLKRGRIPGARKIGGVWCLDVDVYRAALATPGDLPPLPPLPKLGEVA